MIMIIVEEANKVSEVEVEVMEKDHILNTNKNKCIREKMKPRIIENKKQRGDRETIKTLIKTLTIISIIMDLDQSMREYMLP